MAVHIGFFKRRLGFWICTDLHFDSAHSKKTVHILSITVHYFARFCSKSANRKINVHCLFSIYLFHYQYKYKYIKR